MEDFIALSLRPLDEAWLPTLRGWFPDAESCRRWGGPDFRHPFTAAGFREDLRFDDLATFGLVDEAGALLGVGQYAERWGRCHLSRLAIAPDRRGEGLGRELIRRLASAGGDALGVETCSLFVFPDNPAAALYRRLGFVEAELPRGVPAPAGCRYLVAPSRRLERGDLS
ncbi:GNAT family N-acetyltransferase [Halomonas organivorans]